MQTWPTRAQVQPDAISDRTVGPRQVSCFQGMESAQALHGYVHVAAVLCADAVRP